MEFMKFEAAGNDFILIDGMGFGGAWREPMGRMREVAPIWCDRHKGIGADGILVVTQPLSREAVARMNIINADGSMASMCGNGIRCVARWLDEKGIVASPLPIAIETEGGIHRVLRMGEADDGMFDVEMARVDVVGTCEIARDGHVWRGIEVNVGNPHAVFECENPREALVESGSFLSHHPHFPDRCNVEFIREVTPETLEFYVYERGVGPTLACGTGCVAAATAFVHRHGLAGKRIEIHAPGGRLFVETPASGEGKVHLQGPARFSFKGTI